MQRNYCNGAIYLTWEPAVYYGLPSNTDTSLIRTGHLSFQPRPQGLPRGGARAEEDPFSYPEPILRAVNGARQGALAKSISNWHLIGYNEGYCSNTGYILLPCFHGIRLWIWPEPLVAPRVRRALGTRMRKTLVK